MESLDSVIATLNNLGIGALDKIEAELAWVREELEQRQLGELVEKLDSCREALSRGDLAEFRRLRETLVSRLGHLRLKMDRQGAEKSHTHPARAERARPGWADDTGSRGGGAPRH